MLFCRGDFTFKVRLFKMGPVSDANTFSYLQNCFQKILQQEDCSSDLTSTLFLSKNVNYITYHIRTRMRFMKMVNI